MIVPYGSMKACTLVLTIFINRLKSKGYLVEPNNATTSDAVIDYKDMNFVKDVCLYFAHDYFNLFNTFLQVCSTCNLLGSYDRAYVILKELEAAAHTMDIVHVLLSYALDPFVIWGEKPPVKERIDASARNLLSNLTKLSETSCDVELPTLVAKASPRKKKTFSGNDDEEFKNVEMKRRDWMCPT
ncbi:hypothetical protein CRYUN_Cryun19dG0055100 [Craigia yunnanensis]